MAESISPEERLFKIIQQGKLAAAQETVESGKKKESWVERFKHSLIPQPAKGGSEVPWKTRILERIQWPELDPGKINGVLAVVLGIILAVGTYAVFGKHKDVAEIAEKAMKAKSLPEESKKNEPLKSLSYYLGEIQKRDIFRARVVVPVVAEVQVKSESLTKAVDGIKLQGISWGAVPKAMILCQDGKDSKMYFLTEGQPVGTTGLKVILITRTTVKVSDGKEETVLL